MKAGEFVRVKKEFGLKMLMVGMILGFEENECLIPGQREGAIVFWIQGPQSGKEMWYPLSALEAHNEV